MNDRAASHAVSKSATPKNCAASCGVFIIPRSGINQLLAIAGLPISLSSFWLTGEGGRDAEKNFWIYGGLLLTALLAYPVPPIDIGARIVIKAPASLKPSQPARLAMSKCNPQAKRICCLPRRPRPKSAAAGTGSAQNWRRHHLQFETSKTVNRVPFLSVFYPGLFWISSPCGR